MPPNDRESLDLIDDLAEAGETSVPDTHHRTKDYFTAHGNVMEFSAPEVEAVRKGLTMLENLILLMW